jgi:hypothetical protein
LFRPEPLSIFQRVQQAPRRRRCHQACLYKDLAL